MTAPHTMASTSHVVSVSCFGVRMLADQSTAEPPPTVAPMKIVAVTLDAQKMPPRSKRCSMDRPSIELYVPCWLG